MDTYKLRIIVGSVRQGRFGPVVAAWMADQARQHSGFEVEIVDLADVEIPLSLPPAPPKFAGADYPRPSGMSSLTHALTEADAFVFITPEYNHSFPASLKAAIDWHFDQWAGKAVAVVSYGGAAGGRHAALHLENVMTELNAATVSGGLGFPNYFLEWEDGRPVDDQAPIQAKALLDRLAWWARALHAARSSTPFPA